MTNQNKLYLIKLDNNENIYKIGVSKNPKSRLLDLQVANPYKIKMVLTFKYIDAYELERYFHNRYSDYNIRGEWFCLSGELVDEMVGILEDRVDNYPDDEITTKEWLSKLDKKDI